MNDYQTTRGHHLWSINRNRRTSARLVALDGDDLIIVRSKRLTIFRPGIKMRLNVDRATNTLLLPHRLELLERRCSIDRRLVGPCRLKNDVRAAVSSDGTLFLSSRARVVRAVGLDDVVLDQVVTGPAVQGNVGVDTGGVPGTGVGDVADTARVLVDNQSKTVGRGGGECTQPFPATKLPTFDH